MPLDELVTSANQVVQTADTLLASEGVAEVPPNLAAALDELRGLLAELREGGAVNNLNATLASADRAAGAVENAANELPALVANLNRVAAEAERALASVSPGSEINRDTLLLLQEVRDAARSINAAGARARAAPQLGPLREMSMRFPPLLAAALALAACGSARLLPAADAAGRRRAAPRRSARSSSPTSACRPTPTRSRSRP